MPGPPVPNRPTLREEDYDLNGIERFGQNAGIARGDSQALGTQGKQLYGTSMEAQNRATPTTNFGRTQAFTGQQAGAGNWLRDFANGPQAESAAQAQLREGAAQSMQQSLALARSGGGFGESAGSLADAQRANADTMASASNESARLRAQEDQAFQAQRLQAMTGAADVYGQVAGAEGDRARFLTETELQTQQMRDAMQLGLGDQSINAQTQGIQGQVAAGGLDLDSERAALEGRIARGQQEAGLYGTEADVFATREARDRALHEQRRGDRGEAAGVIGGVAGAVASVLSDERAKTNARRTSLQNRYAALRD